ncbi:MAG: TonB family protein [Acidobacteriota bacterium]
MSSDKRRPREPDNQEDYETTILDFLEKEMATVQPTEKKDPQSEELDALVSDLLKKVITETERPQTLNELVYDKEDELFSDLTPNLTKASDPGSNAPDPGIDQQGTLQAMTPAKPAGPDNAVVAGHKSSSKSLTAPRPWELFASKSPAQTKKPLVMAAAVAGIAVILGAAGYFFFASSNKTPAVPKSPPAAAQAIKPQPKAVSAPIIQPPVNGPEMPAVTTKPNPVPAEPASKQPDKPSQSSVQQSVKPTPPKEKPEAAPVKPANAPAPVKEEKPAATPPQPQEPAPTPVSAALEKPASTPVSDSSPVTPEKKPVAPSPAPPMSAVQPPAEMRNPVAAIPISQATPVYPEIALRTRASGSVVLELQIDEQGKVTKATPVSGPNIFYNAAVAAAMKWRYKPASIGGVNVSSASKVTMDFNLKK